MCLAVLTLLVNERTQTRCSTEQATTFVPGVLSPCDVGKLSLPLVLSPDWSISISVAWTVCQAGFRYLMQVMVAWYNPAHVLGANTWNCHEYNLILLIYFLIRSFCSYSEDSGIPGIPGFRDSGIPCFPNYLLFTDFVKRLKND